MVRRYLHPSRHDNNDYWAEITLHADVDIENDL